MVNIIADTYKVKYNNECLALKGRQLCDKN